MSSWYPSVGYGWSGSYGSWNGGRRGSWGGKIRGTLRGRIILPEVHWNWWSRTECRHCASVMNEAAKLPQTCGRRWLACATTILYLLAEVLRQELERHRKVQWLEEHGEAHRGKAELDQHGHNRVQSLVRLVLVLCTARVCRTRMRAGARVRARVRARASELRRET